MNIAIYMPIFIMFLAMMMHRNNNRKWYIVNKAKHKRGYSFMSEYLKRYIGKRCQVSTGSFDVNLQGTITAIEDKWIEIEVKENKPVEIVNLDFVQKIKILKDKSL